MADTGGNASQRRQLRAFGDRLIDAIRADEEGLAALVDDVIRQRIADGHLIEADKLLLGGATVVRAKELEDLRERVRAYDDAIYRAQVLGDEKNYRAAMAVLDEVRPPEEVDEDEDEPVDEPVDEPEVDEPASVEEQEPPAAPAAPEEPQVSDPEPREEPPAAPAPAATAPDDGRARVKVRVPPPPPPGQVQTRSQNGGGTGQVAYEPTGKPVGMPDINGGPYSCNRCDDNDVPGLQASLSWSRTREVLCKDDLIKWKEPLPPKAGEQGDDEDAELETTVA